MRPAADSHGTCRRDVPAGRFGAAHHQRVLPALGLALDIVVGMVVMVPLLIPRVNPGAWRWHVGTLAC